LKRYFGKIDDGSLRGSIFSMASITFGSGCLMFPYAVYCVGPIIALIIFIIVTILSYWTLYLLVWSGMKKNMMDYNQLLEELVGKNFRIFSDINNIILTVGVIMSYQNIISAFSLNILKDFFGVEETQLVKLIQMFSMMFLTQLPLSLLRDMGKLQFASILGTFALLYTIIVMLIELPNHLKENLINNEIEWFKPIDWSILDTMSIFLYGYCSHNGIFPVYQELKNPTAERNLKVLDRSVILEGVLYLSISTAGYFAAFPHMNQIILEASCYTDVAIKIGKITLIICLTCTMAINYNIMRQSFKTMFFEGEIIPFKYELIIAIVLYILMTFFTYSIKSIIQIMGFIGGFCTCVICYVNPFIIYIKCSGKSLKDWYIILCIIIAVLMSGIGIAATVKSIVDMITGN
jgi:amino acid permease